MSYKDRLQPYREKIDQQQRQKDNDNREQEISELIVIQALRKNFDRLGIVQDVFTDIKNDLWEGGEITSKEIKNSPKYYSFGYTPTTEESIYHDKYIIETTLGYSFPCIGLRHFSGGDYPDLVKTGPSINFILSTNGFDSSGYPDLYNYCIYTSCNKQNFNSCYRENYLTEGSINFKNLTSQDLERISLQIIEKTESLKISFKFPLGKELQRYKEEMIQRINSGYYIESGWETSNEAKILFSEKELKLLFSPPKSESIKTEPPKKRSFLDKLFK